MEGLCLSGITVPGVFNFLVLIQEKELNAQKGFREKHDNKINGLLKAWFLRG